MDGRLDQDTLVSSVSCTEDCIFYRYDEQAKSPHTVTTLREQSQGHGLNAASQAQQLYKPIREWEIRILELHPAVYGDALVADLCVAVITHDDSIVLTEKRIKTKYEALSYCWGRPISNGVIEINGIRYPITESLENALHEIRLKGQPRYLWIDALCINQHNNLERSLQIQNMLLIYKWAKVVLVWLGEAGENTELVAHYLSMDHGTNKVKKRTHSQIDRHDSLHSLSGITDQACKRHCGELTAGARDLLSRPWYSRLWVKQEVWKAKEIEVICGRHRLNWNSLVELAKELSQRSEDFRDPFRGLLTERSRDPDVVDLASHSLARFLADRRWNDLPDVHLAKVLERTSSGQCLDPRDHVYAVLGMSDARYGFLTPDSISDSSNEARLAIDYNRPTAQVYQDVMRYWIESNRDLRVFLWFYGARQSHTRESIYGGEVDGQSLPSWCPNFSRPWSFDREPWFQLDSGSFMPYDNQKLRYPRVVSGALHLTGVTIARVHRICDGWTPLKPRHNRVRRHTHPFWAQRRTFLGKQSVRGDKYGEGIAEVMLGDSVVLVAGSSMPCLLRRNEKRGAFQFVDAIFPADIGLYFSLSPPFWNVPDNEIEDFIVV